MIHRKEASRFIRVTLLAATFLTLISTARGAVPEFKCTIDQTLVEYSYARPKTFRSTGRVAIRVDPFIANDSFKGENIGALTAEIISRHLAGIKKLEVRRLTCGKVVPRSDEVDCGMRDVAIIVAGQIERQNDAYRISLRFLDSEGIEVAAREVEIPSRKFHRMLNGHLRWKRQTWIFQPYLQALYTERYLAEGYPSRVISSIYDSMYTSSAIDISRLAVDETAEFTAGLRLTWRKRLMLDVAYTAHGHSTTEGQQLVAMTNLVNPDNTSRMLSYISTSAVSASLCGRAALYGGLHGYAGVGWERTMSVQAVSSMSRLYFSGPGGTSEVRGYFLSPEGPLPNGGKITDKTSLPFLRAGVEWRPGRLGFNFLATYRLDAGNFRPLSMAVEEIYSPSGSYPRQVSYTIMEVSRYRLPRLSVGAAFALIL